MRRFVFPRLLAVGGADFTGALSLGNDYLFFTGSVVAQYVVLSTASTSSAAITAP